MNLRARDLRKAHWHMETSWYLLHIHPPKKEEQEEDPPEPLQESPEKAEQESAAEKVEEEKRHSLTVPQVGTPICHFLGLSDGFSERDKKNVLWDKIQDGARPAWAPDFLRLGYAVCFKREGLPKLAVKLGIRNPATVTNEDRRRSRARILTFDDVMVMGCVPHMNPMYFPDKDLDVEEWWLATKENRGIASPYLAPKGVTVATGAQRLADVVIQMLRTPNGYPRGEPQMEDMPEPDDYSEFINPLLPIRPRYDRGHGDNATGPETGYGWAGIELFRQASGY